MGISETIAGLAVQFIQNTGYVSVFILMVMESMVIPMPSEAVMPFAGWLIADGVFTWPAVILISTVGSVVGSIISYSIGFYGGKPFVAKFGKYLFLNNEHLEKTQLFFDRRGGLAVLICRFVPVVRHLISIPAGVARMNIWLFLIYTTIGACIWNTILTFSGTVLQKNWGSILKYSKYIDWLIVLLLATLLMLFIIRHIRKVHTNR